MTGSRLAPILLGAAVTAGVGVVAVTLWLHSVSPAGPASAGTKCVVRVLVEEKGEERWYTFTPEDSNLSEADFDPDTLIGKLQIEGCSGSAVRSGSG
jgi:hypothetical protein